MIRPRVICNLGVFLLGSALALAAPTDKSGVKPNVISLPKGAGSIEGLGESFEPQINTGGSTYGVSIALPPGRAGLQPSVRLGYNSNTGNGLGGIGWNIELSSIKRQTDKGVPGYTPADTFVFGGEELVPLTNTEGDWRCENEGGFQRLRQFDADGDGSPDAWEVTDPNGTRHQFGRFRGVGGRWSVVENPDKSGSPALDRTYAWLIDTTIDLHGNRIDYEYLQGQGLLYPSRISYNHLGAASQEVIFSYETRPDVFDDFRPTFACRFEKRLSRIEVKSQGALVRAYEFRYAYEAGDLNPEEAAAQASALDLGVSLLKRVVQLDNSGNLGNYLPPLVFIYSGLNLAQAEIRQLASSPGLDLAEPNGRVQLADVDGDGRPDLFSTVVEGAALTQKVCLNRGEQTTGGVAQLVFEPLKVALTASGVDLGLPETALDDQDGNALIDVARLVEAGGNKHLETFRNRARLDFATGTHLGFGLDNLSTSILQNPPAYVSYIQPGTRQVDINFDKHSDFITLAQVGGQMKARYYYEKHHSQWEEGESVLPASFPSGRTFALAGKPNPALHLADMNGDRMLDLVLINPSGDGVTVAVSYWPLTGLGTFGEKKDVVMAGDDYLHLSASDKLPDVFVQDMTGDGLADLLYMESAGSGSRLVLRVNIAGQTWSAPIVKTGLPRYDPRALTSPTVFRIADVNGNGSTDLLFRNTSPGDTWDYVELQPKGKPSLITTIDNGLGKRTTIVYGNALDDERSARLSGNPWRTYAPLPLQVVRQIRTTGSLDLNGDGQPDTYVAEFHYRDPFWDGLEMEFRGFAFAQRTDYGDDALADPVTGLMTRSAGWDTSRSPTGQVGGPSLVTRFRFHTGAGDQLDNDDYGDTVPALRLIDEVTEVGGREEEVLKGRQLVEEKLDARVLDAGAIADFDAGCVGASAATTFQGRGKLTPDDFVYTRAYQEWTIRRLYRPTQPIPYLSDQDQDGEREDYYDFPIAPVPAGRFEARGISVAATSERSVSFAFVGRAATEIHEANGTLSTSLGYPARGMISTRSTFDHDDYGNQTSQKDYGVDGGTLDDERFTTTTYALGGEALTRWIINKPDTIAVTDENGVFVSKKTHFYDGTPFVGVAGAIGPRALLSRTREYRTATEFIEATRSKFDAYGNIEEMKDPVGNLRRIGWDTTLKTYPVSETIVVGGGNPDLAMSVGYDFRFGVVTSARDFNDNETRYGYDSFGRLVTIVKPGDTEALPTQSFFYQPADPLRGRLYSYAADGTLTLVSVPVGSASRVITRQREVSGASGEFVTATYVDGTGKALAEIEEGTVANTWIVKKATSYNLRGSPAATWQPFQIGSVGVPDFSAIWPAGRPPVSDGINPAIVKTDIYQDSMGREIRTVLPPETWGGLRRETATQILPLEKSLFDEEDLLAGSPHFGTAHVQHLDGLGRLVGVEETVKLTDTGVTGPLVSWLTAYRYDLNDQLTRITDSQNNIKTMVYDGLKRLTFMNDPDRGTLNYIYDDASNLRETLDAKGQRIVMTYDGANRIRTEDYMDAAGRSPDVEYFYDTPTTVPVGDGTTAASAQVKGKLRSVTDLSGEEHISYDSRGRAAWKIKRIPDPRTGVLSSYQTALAYDSLDRVTQLTYPDGDTVGYGYNARNLPQTITGGPGGFIIADTLYRPAGQLDTITYGNGVATASTYDPRLRLRSLQTTKAATQLIRFAYQFDGASNITRIDDERSAIAASDPRKNTQVFSYDNLYRLTGVQYPALLSGSVGQIAHAYDRIGNMLTQTSNITATENGLPVVNLGTMGYGGAAGPSGRVGRATGEAPGPHALTSVSGGGRSYPYDANGNMETIDGLACTWDFKDRLVAVENAMMRAEYTYDYTDRRITKSVVPKVGTAVPSGPSPDHTLYIDRTYELRPGAAPVKYVWNGETRVARVTTNLNAAQRQQRFRLQSGWNICTLAVALTNGGTQLSSPLVSAAYRYAPATGTYHKIAANEVLPVGTLLRIQATASGELAVRGTPAPAVPLSYAAGSHWIGNSGFQPFDIATAFPADAGLWLFDPGPQAWLTRMPGASGAAVSLPARLESGEVLFATPVAPFILSAVDATLDIRYYHQDHLGSSSVVSDTTAQLVSETTFYPFGHPRNEYEPRSVREAYGFTQKERDRESGLNYFEARYIGSSLGRFTSVDPLVKENNYLWLLEPAQSNCYAYANGNPIMFSDPSGLFAWRDGVSVGVGFIPLVGTGQSAVELFSGRDYITGEPANRWLAAAGLIAGLAPGGVGALKGGAKMFSAGARSADEAVDLAKVVARKGDGVIYKRIDPASGASYVGQSIDDANYAIRQTVHNKKFAITHDYQRMGSGRPGVDLNVLEEAFIRSEGGLMREGGLLQNARHQMNPLNFVNETNDLLRGYQGQMLLGNGMLNGASGAAENVNRK